ncbi:phosphate/phosphite/phosphonate ABC transporter substrate-binding protein [Kaarinaea lacus]
MFLATTRLAVAELIMTAPPREQAEAGEKIYAPLAAHLSELLGEKVTYKQPKNWLEYQRDLRHDVYDIVFDGPHFVSWRVAHLNHDVLVKLPGTLEFVIVIKKNDQEIKAMKDLVGKKICGIPPPNLATLTVIEQFQNPVRQPIIWGVPGGFKSVHETFLKGECRAAVFRTTYYEKKLTDIDRAQMHVLYKSKALPNQAISVSSRVNSKYKQEIIRSLTLDDKGKKATLGIVKRFGGAKASPFIAAKKDEYIEQSSLLEGVVFGW